MGQRFYAGFLVFLVLVGSLILLIGFREAPERLTLTVSQLESLRFSRDSADDPPVLIFVGYPYGVKAVPSDKHVYTLPSYWKELWQLEFWVDTDRANPYYGWYSHFSVWEWHMYDNVVPDPGGDFEFRLTTLENVFVMLLTPKNGKTVTLSFRIFNNGNPVSIAVRKDASSTEIEVTVSGIQVCYLKADKVAKGASITDSSAYADSWPDGASEITYSGTAEKYVNISFDVETQLRWSVALDGYMNDVKTWVGDPSSWDTYENVVATVKQAWLDELNSLPLSLDTFDVNFYRALTAWLGMVIDASPIQFNGFKAKGYIPADTPFVFIPSNTNVYSHGFQGSLWDIGYGSFYLLALLKPDKALDLVKGMLAVNEHYGTLTAYGNVFAAGIDQARGHPDDSVGFFLILAEALCFDFSLDWQSVFSLADSLMQDWRNNSSYLGKVTEDGYFPYRPGGTANPSTMELIYFEYLLSYLASKAGDTSKKDFYRGFAENTSLLSKMYDAEHNRFRVPDSPYDWSEGEASSGTTFFYYSYCSPSQVEQVVDLDVYISDLQHFLDYNNDYNEYELAAAYIPILHGCPDISWRNVNSLIFPSLHYQMSNFYSIWENFETPRTGELYERKWYAGYASNHAQYVLNYLGLYHIQGYPFTFIGIPQANYRIGGLHVVVEGGGDYVDTVELNGFEWKALKLPSNVKSLSGVLRIKLTSDPDSWRKSRFILPDNGYYAVTNIIDRPLAGKFKFTVSSPVSETHTIRLYFEPAPLKVFGAESWSYDEAEKILTLTVKTGSEAAVTVIYGEPCPGLFSRILDRYGVSSTIMRNQPTATDDYGNPVPNWVEVASENVIVQPLKAEEKPMLPGVFREADAKAFLKPDSLVEPGDRVIISGEETYQVLTVLPQRLGKCVHHLLSALKLVREEA